MTIWAKRFQPETANPIEVAALIEGFVQHPEFSVYPLPLEQARQVGAWMLGNPGHIVWTTYQGKELTGTVILSRIVPPVDALLHFMFLDRNLVSKRKLLNNILGICFREFGFHRLSLEVPEGIRLERFARSVLRFRYEGEIRARNPELPASLTDNWVAKQGSRVEEGYFNGTSWSDVLRLRLLASEWVGDEERGPDCQSEPSSVPPHQSSGG